MNDPAETFEKPAVAAEMLNTSLTNVRRLIARGELAAIRVGNCWRIPRSALLAYCESGTVKTNN